MNRKFCDHNLDVVSFARVVEFLFGQFLVFRGDKNPLNLPLLEATLQGGCLSGECGLQ